MTTLIDLHQLSRADLIALVQQLHQRCQQEEAASYDRFCELLRLVDVSSQAFNGDLTVRGAVTPSQVGCIADCLNHLLADLAESLRYVPEGHPLHQKYSLDKLPNLQSGDSGQAVMDLQTLLKQKRLYGGPIDGVFGHRLRNSVKLFQSQKNLEVTGTVNQTLWHLLRQPSEDY